MKEEKTDSVVQLTLEDGDVILALNESGLHKNAGYELLFSGATHL